MSGQGVCVVQGGAARVLRHLCLALPVVVVVVVVAVFCTAVFVAVGVTRTRSTRLSLLCRLFDRFTGRYGLFKGWFFHGIHNRNLLESPADTTGANLRLKFFGLRLSHLRRQTGHIKIKLGLLVEEQKGFTVVSPVVAQLVVLASLQWPSKRRSKQRLARRFRRRLF